MPQLILVNIYQKLSDLPRIFQKFAERIENIFHGFLTIFYHSQNFPKTFPTISENFRNVFMQVSQNIVLMYFRFSPSVFQSIKISLNNLNLVIYTKTRKSIRRPVLDPGGALECNLTWVPIF